MRKVITYIPYFSQFPTQVIIYQTNGIGHRSLCNKFAEHGLGISYTVQLVAGVSIFNNVGFQKFAQKVI